MVKAYKQKVFNGQMPVFDGRKNLYSRDPLPIGREKVCTNYALRHCEIFVIITAIIVLFTVHEAVDVMARPTQKSVGFGSAFTR